MSIIPINVFGDNILRKKAKKLADVNGATIEFIKNMFDSMHNAKGIGLAANQVGSNDSIFVVDLSQVEGYEKSRPIVFINPEITDKSSKSIIMEEGCLSLPLLRADVERPEAIEITYFDTDLKQHSLEADDMLARVILHEYDHLQGVMFVDRLTEPDRRSLNPELNKIKKRKIESDYPITELKLKTR